MSDLVITLVVYALGSDCTGVGSSPSDVNLMRLVFHAQTNLPEAVSNGHKTTTHALHRGPKLQQAGTTWSQNCVFQEGPGAPTNAPEPTVSCAAS